MKIKLTPSNGCLKNLIKKGGMGTGNVEETGEIIEMGTGGITGIIETIETGTGGITGTIEMREGEIEIIEMATKRILPQTRGSGWIDNMGRVPEVTIRQLYYITKVILMST